jgi:hypothetical protein
VRLTPRKRLFVDRQIQGTLLFRIVIYWCFSVLAVCLFVLCARAIDHPAGSFLDYFAIDDFFIQYGAVILASALLVPLIMYDALVISNRFAGPLLRMRRSMRALAGGEYVAPIQFREKDYWRDFAEEFNAIAEYVEQLKKQLAEAQGRDGKTSGLQAAAHE